MESLLKPKTVMGVYEKYTAELKKVQQQQEAKAKNAKLEQERLQARLNTEAEKEKAAEAETKLATAAMESFAELLGISKDN